MPDHAMPPDALTTIIGEKYVEVEEGLRETSLNEMERQAKSAPAPRDFQGALCATVALFFVCAQPPATGEWCGTVSTSSTLPKKQA